ncbi:MAG: hypothetical protein ACXW1Y_09125 [Acidimicrobiia bacterium]
MVASHDGRSRRATARGFDVEEAITQRDQLERFWNIAVGREELTTDEANQYLFWWRRQIGDELQMELEGLPVPGQVAAAAQEAGVAGFHNVIT